MGRLVTDLEEMLGDGRNGCGRPDPTAFRSGRMMAVTSSAGRPCRSACAVASARQ